MPRKAQELSALAVKRLQQEGLHAVGGVAGLHLQVGVNGARSWILRASIGGKRRDIGLGGFPDVPVADAREKARQVRVQIEQGQDPVLKRKEALSALLAARRAEITFEQAAGEYIASQGKAWKNAKHHQQWQNTLSAYVFPVIGKMHVKDVQLHHIIKILEPIWDKKTETAKRLRGRIESVLDWATVRKYREGENPARWRGHLDKILPSPEKVIKRTNFKALPLGELGGFMQDLVSREGMGARALEFAILTAARSGEVRGAVWSEIDLNNATWTIPAGRMKAGKEHRVPLSKRSVELLKSLPRFANTELVFPAARGETLSDMTLTQVLRRMDVDATVHGFRSTFRDWAAERTNYPREVAEMALAHTLSNKVEAAYFRTDLFEKRRRMMQEWEKFCRTTHQAEGKLIKFNGAK